MEHCPGSEYPIKMVPLAAGWSDLGAWDAVWQVLPKDEARNAHVGDVLATDSRNTLVQATSRLVSLVGVDNLVVIENTQRDVNIALINAPALRRFGQARACAVRPEIRAARV